MDLSIVIPVYNEEKNIYDLTNNIFAILNTLNKTYEIIYVDDGSKDKTVEVIQRLITEKSSIKLIQFRRNFGQTAALAAGIENSTGDIIITMDGDGQNDPSSIPDLLNKINEGYDLVAGWRKDRKDKYISRKIPSAIANYLISFSTKVKIHDHGCTMRAVKRDILKELNLYGEQHRFISVLVAWSGAKYTEIPVKHNPRKHGESKYGILRTYKVLLDLFTIIFINSYATKPIYLFGGTGILSFILSFITISIAFYQKYFSKIQLYFITNPLTHLAALLVILGFMFILIGLLAEIIIRTYYETTKKSIYIIKNKYGFNYD